MNHLFLSSGFYITELPPLIVPGVMVGDRLSLNNRLFQPSLSATRDY
ncbi:hypothetical protein IQ276_012450 [Desmonostoc muscorum LEGE 12446]|uniref:Uncharacterized protein n=1 Tax=Desmonostoc muscorum LEGE 12446 TaxID=1828758 RepID=A0A8J6ZIT9_DESMC|nr:hypothetical protein [Desmonostoc muscorum]MCF2147240.1 hypothetical protein [Desmonostoc muscorum LEGE 12446]